ncbi:unnamed protein product [Polarella glacialis]|uniref:RNA-editing substrate-binding complex 6 protein domain-containing protein n=1 Tax=Polarella glacialis TaxID=89957 RepID=A0A813LY06_POLGL|nr:unnamed protein product [Polarella glacialis]
MMSQFNEHELAMISWAFATAGMKHSESELFHEIAAAAMPRMGEFNEQDLAMSAWAFATAGTKQAESELLHGLAAAAVPRIGKFKEQELAMTAWAFAKAGVSHSELFCALSTTALPRIGKFTSQGLPNLVWAFASVAWSDPELFNAVASEALLRISEFTYQGLSNLAWAFVRADLIPPRKATQLLEAIAVRARQQNWSVLQAASGPPSLSAVEARCAELVLRWIPGSTRNRYFMGFELDIVFEVEDGRLINLEIDEPYHRTPKQSALDARRDGFLKQCGVCAVRFVAFDESGPLREDREEPALQALLRYTRLLPTSPSERK